MSFIFCHISFPFFYSTEPASIIDVHNLQIFCAYKRKLVVIINWLMPKKDIENKKLTGICESITEKEKIMKAGELN